MAGASTEEENVAAAAAAEEEEELRRTDLERRIETAAADPERRMEATVEAAEIAKRGIKEAFQETWVKATTAKATAFLLFLVEVCTDRCTIF